VSKGCSQWIGRTCSVIGLAYVGALIWHDRSVLGAIEWRSLLIAGAVAALVAYTAAGILSGLSWGLILRGLGITVSLTEALRIVLVTNIVKYLPGNVFHYVGRYALGLEHQSGARGVIGVSLLVETVIVVAVAAILALGFLGHRLPLLAQDVGGAEHAPLVSIGLAAFIAVIVVSHFLVPRMRRLVFKETPLGLGARWWIVSSLLTSLSFGLHALGLFIIVTCLAPPEVPQFTLLVGAFALAWLSGFLLPGVPGGLGIREFVLVVLLTPVTGQGIASGAAIVARGISVVGDVVLWLGAQCVLARRRSSGDGRVEGDPHAKRQSQVEREPP
jgi:uncharacterized membrane protein YbhN (UPF0104 family)